MQLHNWTNFFHQCLYLKHILWEYIFFNSSPISIPTNCNYFLHSQDITDNIFFIIFFFTNAIDNLQFSSIGIDLDITYLDRNVVQFKLKYIQAYYNKVKKIFYYIYTIIDFKLAYRRTTSLTILNAFVDANYTTDLDDINLQVIIFCSM